MAAWIHDPVVAVTLLGFLDAIGRGLREAVFMLWETIWALVLGFGLSGAVQAFVSKEEMQRALGDHGPRSIARASGFGAMSSSCSYAASAMAKSLFAKGADFVSAMVFMVASTNLVIELGLVLLVLIGWQFTAAEFVGGPLMIVLLAFIGGMVLRGPAVEKARKRLTQPAPAKKVGLDTLQNLDASAPRDGHQLALERARTEHQRKIESEPWAKKLRSKAAWADAATYAIADITMLRKELVIGYTVAGFLAALVPEAFWSDLFVTGHGGWTTLENAFIGPLIAVASWVCSVGNVPLAAALWKGGISFGGVISFIFADLISMPLILIYRRLYGGRLALQLVLVLYPVMALSGLAVGELFSAAGIVPTLRRASVVAVHFSWNYTSVLNIAFLLALVGIWWLKRHREQLGGGAGFAIDPVCGMQVRIADAPAESDWGGKSYWFCSDRCRERFEAEPDHFTRLETPPVSASSVVAAAASLPMVVSRGSLDAAKKEVVTDTMTSTTDKPDLVVDPVCHMVIDPDHAAAHRHYQDKDYYFCNLGCADAFDADPARYMQL